MTKRVYFDTSVYLDLLLGNEAASRFKSALRGAQFCSSTLLLIEAERNLVRLSRERKISADIFSRALSRLQADVEIFVLKELSIDLCLQGNFPAVRTPRSLDLVHLRTASWFKNHGGLAAFLTLDDVLLQSVQELGLPTY